eukprot:17661-Heterococcus_DN1.PRE.5
MRRCILATQFWTARRSNAGAASSHETLCTLHGGATHTWKVRCPVLRVQVAVGEAIPKSDAAGRGFGTILIDWRTMRRSGLPAPAHRRRLHECIAGFTYDHQQDQSVRSSAARASQDDAAASEAFELRVRLNDMEVNTLLTAAATVTAIAAAAMH